MTFTHSRRVAGSKFQAFRYVRESGSVTTTACMQCVHARGPIRQAAFYETASGSTYLWEDQEREDSWEQRKEACKGKSGIAIHC